MRNEPILGQRPAGVKHRANEAIGRAPPRAVAAPSSRKNWVRFLLPHPGIVFFKSFTVHGYLILTGGDLVRFARLSHLKRDASGSHSPRLGSFRTIRPVG
jgi:hypothetical protein